MLKQQQVFRIVLAFLGLGVCRICLGESVSFRLAYEGPASVPAGSVVTLHVRATYDFRIVGTQFSLRATREGAASVDVQDRSVIAGLSFIASESQNPMSSGLPHALADGPLKEVLLDLDPEGQPGGLADGIPAGADVLVETLRVVVTGAGTLTFALSDVAAVSTSLENPGGRMCDSAEVDPSASAVTIQVVEDLSAADLNNDRQIDSSDLDILLAAYGRQSGQQQFNPAADLDKDGSVTTADYEAWLYRYRLFVHDAQAPSPLEILGDFQRDGRVDILDLEHLVTCAAGPQVVPGDASCQSSDLDYDNDVDVEDFAILQRCISGPDHAIDLGCKY